MFSKRNFDYRELKKEFPTELVQHFPDTIYKNDSYTHDIDYNIGSEVFIVLSKNIDNIEKYNEKYKQKAIDEYIANDTCLLVVNEYINETNYYKTNIEDVSTSCNDSFFPVPNFWILKFENVATVKTKLPDDFKIYVFDAKTGIYWNKGIPKTSNSMPSKWKNGYSKGVSISLERKEIIYWVIIW